MEPLSSGKRQILLHRKELLEQQIKELNAKPIGKSNASAVFRKQDLTALARKIVLINERLYGK